MKKIKTFLCLSFLGSFLTACAAGDHSIPDTPVENLYNLGHTYFQQKNYETCKGTGKRDPYTGKKKNSGNRNWF